MHSSPQLVFDSSLEPFPSLPQFPDAPTCVEVGVAAPYTPPLSPITDSSAGSTTGDGCQDDIPGCHTPCSGISRSPTVTPSPAHSVGEFERLNLRLASAFTIFFVLGWGDGVTGTLLPYFTEDFHLTFMTSSLCFVASTVGFWTGTLFVERLLSVMGRICISVSSPARTVKLWHRPSGLAYGHSATRARFIMVCTGTLLHPMFFVIMGCRWNFPTMLVAYVISAFARSMLSGENPQCKSTSPSLRGMCPNIFCSNRNHYVASTPRKALGYMYGYWSIGSMCGPLVCQSIIATGIAWNHFYFGSLVLSGISAALAFVAFRPTDSELEQDISKAQNEIQSANTSSSTLQPPKKHKDMVATKEEEAGASELKDAPPPKQNLLRAIQTPIVWAFAIFCGIYTGTEASTQGFIVTYLLSVRDADPKTVGYCTSGFWGGLAISRFIWGFLNTRLTYMHRKYIVQSCIGKAQPDRWRYISLPVVKTALALGLHLTIWFIDSFVANAIATAFIGLSYGPIFVGNIAQANEAVPQDLHMISMQIIVSLGSFGAALFPFLTGTLLNFVGPKTLTYILVTQCTALSIIWFCLPSRK